jgi:urease accessory protein
MLIQQKMGNLDAFIIQNRVIDWLPLEWYETGKRILRKKTVSGKEIFLKFLNESPALSQGDILFEDDRMIIAVEILPCDCLVIRPKDLFEMAAVCYEIGNKHLPLFFEENNLLVPLEQPLFRLLNARGYGVKQEKRKLLHPLPTTVSPHAHGRESLFSKIMKMTVDE